MRNNRKAITHYANVERGNESYPHDEWGETACGLEYTDSDLSDKWEYVSCKNCLKTHKNLNLSVKGQPNI